MTTEKDLLASLVEVYPNGVDAIMRYALNQALGVDPHGDVSDYLKRVQMLKHKNGLVEVRLDYQAMEPGATGTALFALGLPGTAAPGDPFGRPVYFGAEAERVARLNLLRQVDAGAADPVP